MKIYTDMDQIALPSIPGVSLAIGNFDGVHIGHQKIIQNAVEKGRLHGLVPGVFTFKNHPKNILAGKKILQPISTPWEKMTFFKKLGLELCIVADVDKQFLRQSPDTFIRDVLVRKLSARFISVGPNFRFGREAKGSIVDLQRLAEMHHFEVEALSLVERDDLVVSSTRIRALLQEGKFQMANDFLGRRVFHSGVVVKGNQMGRKMGFPTANLQLSAGDHLEPGVFGVHVFMKGEIVKGIMNVGKAPTLTDGYETRVEIHLVHHPDVSLYDQQMTFRVHSKIRDEKTFASPRELMRQIEMDVASLS